MSRMRSAYIMIYIIVEAELRTNPILETTILKSNMCFPYCIACISRDYLSLEMAFLNFLSGFLKYLAEHTVPPESRQIDNELFTSLIIFLDLAPKLLLLAVRSWNHCERCFFPSVSCTVTSFKFY